MMTRRCIVWIGGLILLLNLSACLPTDLTAPGDFPFSSLVELGRQVDLPFIHLEKMDENSPTGGHCSSASGPTIDGSGTLSTETRSVGDFSQVILAGWGSVVIKQTGEHDLSIRADENLLPYLETRVEGDQLWLSMADGVCLQPGDTTVTYFVAVDDLDLVQIIGAGQVQMDELTADELIIRLDGSGQIIMTGLDIGKLETQFNGTGMIDLAGNADFQIVNLNGVGQYQAAGLQANSVSVKLNGTGNIAIWAISNLAVEMNGLGTVSYIGDPQINHAISGLSDIQRIRTK
jgi:hypothetical protein